MKNKVAIIESADVSLSSHFELKKFEYRKELDPQEIDQAIKYFFKENKTIEKIIIPIKLGGVENLGLKFALHIRLTNVLKDKRYIPIIFISAETKEAIIARQINATEDLTATILFTRGVTISKPLSLQEHINNYNEKLTENTYSREFFSKIILKNKRKQGHQLANEWGVFRLARFAGVELTTATLPKDLFFKYSFVKSKQSIETSKGEKIGLKNGINAVLIDDYADKGWFEVLEHILKSNISLYNTKLKKIVKFDDALNFKDYENNTLKMEEMDIVFLDLRLRPEEDKKNDKIANTKELSGMTILKKIKAINQGIQVIILTASNKSWNMKKMLAAGADGYFVKESPEIPLSDELSKANYDSLIENIESCLEKSYLRDIYTQKELLIAILDTHNATNKYDANFLEEIKKQLDIAYTLFFDANSKEKFAYAFVSLYLVIEIINNEFVKKEDRDNKWKIESQIGLLDWKWDNNNKIYSNSNTQLTGSKPPEWVKFTGIFFQKWEQSDQYFVKNIYYQIQMRNHFIHSDEGLNTDIYDPKKGFQALFENIKKIINFL